MAATIKDKATEAGHKIAETVKAAGNKIAEGAEKATGWVKEKTNGGGSPGTTANIREHMEVIASCGKHVGTVDGIEGESVKLTKSDPTAGGMHHFIPVAWVATVDEKVHLNKNSEEVFRN